MLGVGNRVNSTIEILAQRTLWMRSGRRGELQAFHRAMVLQRPPRNLCVHCAKLRIADVIPLSCRPSPRPEPVAFARLQGIHFSQGPALPSGRSIVSISGKVLVFGAAYSVYVRAVRLALEEKSVPYELINVDIFAAGGPPADYLARHPFGRIPAFEHNGFRLYEAAAIERYVDEAFNGPLLQPEDPTARARMNQAIGILDSYAYRTLVWDIFVERIINPREARTSDEPRIAAALPRAMTCLDALESIMAQGPWLAGTQFTLADCHAAPMLDYFRRTAEGEALLGTHKSLSQWWDRMAARPSMSATRP